MTTSANLSWFVAEQVVLVAGLAVVSMILPRLTRAELFFSVTVNRSFRDSPEGQKVVRQFRREIACYSFISLGLMLALAFGLSPIWALAGVVLQNAGIAKAYLTAHRRAKAHAVPPSTQREAILTPRTVRLPGGWLAQLGPFLIPGAIAFYLRQHWNDIPARFPIHWGMDGRPNGWAAKGGAAVFFGPVVGAAMCAFLAALMYGIAHGARRGGGGKNTPDRSRYQQNIFLVVLGLEYGMALLFSYISLLPFKANDHFVFPTWAFTLGDGAFSLLFLFVLARIAARSSQREARLETVADTGPPIGDQTPDRCWKAGLIYFNPDDPALWVEKRFGIGWTINCANPRAWFVMGGILLFAVGLPILLTAWLKR